jgi:hypothetical protein
MKPIECLRENEVIEAVECERWPDRCADDLRAHITSCAICSDVLTVALAIHDERELEYREAQVPSAGLVWWRAELRARQEAIQTVSRPITLVQAFGAASATGAAVALLSRAWPWLRSLFTFSDLAAISSSQWGIVIACALAFLVIAPLAMYLVLSDE